MAFKAEKTKTEEYKAIVKKVIRCKNDSIMFNMELNGIMIHGCFLKSYKDEDGDTMEFIAKPSMKGKDGNYYDVINFPVSEELFRNIKNQINSLLG